MKFRVIKQKASPSTHSPIQVVEQDTGQGVGWINRYLDREYVRHWTRSNIRTFVTQNPVCPASRSSSPT